VAAGWKLLADELLASLPCCLISLIPLCDSISCLIADEQFNYSKSTGFTGDALAGVAVAFTQTAAVSV